MYMKKSLFLLYNYETFLIKKCTKQKLIKYYLKIFFRSIFILNGKFK